LKYTNEKKSYRGLQYIKRCMNFNILVWWHRERYRL